MNWSHSKLCGHGPHHHLPFPNSASLGKECLQEHLRGETGSRRSALWSWEGSEWVRACDGRWVLSFNLPRRVWLLLQDLRNQSVANLDEIYIIDFSPL